MTRVLIGTFASRDSITISQALFEQASATLDEAAGQARREAEAVAADALRLQNTRRARAARRFRKALTLLRGGLR